MLWHHPRMAALHTWGVDLSTNPRHTSAVRMAWDGAAGRITDVITPLDAPRLAELIGTHPTEPWGIDVPFGWPTAFTTFLAQHRIGPAAPAFIDGSWA